jgi:MFS family permease
MFLVGLFPVVVSIMVLLRVKETDKWERVETVHPHVKHESSLKTIFNAQYRKRTIVAAVLLTVAIIGLWAGAVYEPSAVVQLATKAGMDKHDAARMASIATGLLSIGTIIGCLALPPMAEKIGRRKTLAVYFVGMAASIALAFGWAFYLPNGLVPFIALLVVLGFFGGNFALFSLWLPEQFETRVRATAFAFCTSIGRFFGAIVNFGIGAMVLHMKTLGVPIAITAVAFLIGLAVIPLAPETKGQELPN